MAVRCPNPYCDGYGWILVETTGTANTYRTPACRIGPHPPRTPTGRTPDFPDDPRTKYTPPRDDPTSR